VRSTRFRPLLVAVLAVFTMLPFGAGSALALLTDSATSDTNTLGTATWSFNLHNNPTPPAGNTTAQFNLAMDATVPTAGTLYNYDTNCDTNRTGRTLNRITPSPTNTTACQYANWLSPVLPAPVALSGSLTLDAWVATNATQSNQTGALAIYVRDYNPASGTYATIASTVSTATYAAGRTFYERIVAVPVTGTVTVATGHRIELKLEASTAGARNLMVAYDTSTYRSTFRVR
jgi:hypothetical protein